MKKIILLLLFAGSLLSCSDDDSANDNQSLNGHWGLIGLDGEMEPVSYSGQEYQWEIAGDVLTVSVDTEDDLSFLLPEGTYLIEAYEDSFDILTVGHEGTYGYSIHHGNLHVAPPGAEFDAAPHMEFDRLH